MNTKGSSRVPWEPYRGATNSERSSKSSKNDPSAGLSSTSTTTFQKDDLVRYKVDTDLSLFNAQRPGNVFEASDLERIDKQATGETDLRSPSSPPSFIDARFYTDFHFLKLANDLKKKCALPPSSNANTVAAVAKPINVVGPLVEKSNVMNSAKKPVAPETDSSKKSLSSFDSNSVKIWSSQRSQYESRIEYLESQIDGLNEQLQIQTQVNAELKRMLVASVGEDLQYRLERLVSDKQRLQFELINKDASLDRIAEDVEQISIQCDLWRSKFLASKLMVEELSTWKSFLLLLNRENENVVKNILNDNMIVHDKLSRANQLLASLAGSNDSHSPKEPPCNSIQLANSILSQLGSMSNAPAPSKRSTDHLQPNKKGCAKTKTDNELNAEQLLENFDWLSKFCFYPNRQDDSELGQVDSLDKLDELIRSIKLKRSTTHNRLFASSESHHLLNFCNQCTGQLKVV